jgi:DNA-binding CsgD family transcriptional regulator
MATTTIAKRISEISAHLATVRDGEPSALKTVLPEFARLLNAEVATVHGLSANDDSIELDFFYGHGFNEASCAAAYREALNKAPRGVLWFDPRRPSSADCGRLRVTAFADQPSGARWLLDRHVMGGLTLARSLICNDDSTVALLGVGLEGRFGPDQRSSFRALLPAFRRRLQLERWLQEAQPIRRLLHGAMDACGTPAYLLRGTAVVHTNPEGGAALASDRRQVLESLRASLGRAVGSDASFKTVQYSDRGLPTYTLAVARQPSSDVGPRAAALAKRWRLTPRQAQVLAHVAMGRGNRAIADALGCKTATIEFHITSLLERSGCEGRAELVARIWTERP